MSGKVSKERRDIDVLMLLTLLDVLRCGVVPLNASSKPPCFNKSASTKSTLDLLVTINNDEES